MARPRAHLLTIGDELLSGDVIDGNKAWLAQRCRLLGVEVVRATTVRDREDEIVAAIHAAAEQADLCLVSGGLGPTTDDLTAASAAKAAGVGLERDAELAAGLTAFFSRRIPTPRSEAAARDRDALIELNLKQADLPRGATILANPIGTAAGFGLQVGGCWLCSMPGVPRELRKMMREQVEPRVRERWNLSPVARRIHRAIGRGESSLQQGVSPALAEARTRSPGLANMYVHYRARYPEVTLILEATAGPDGVAATPEELTSLDAALREGIGPALYALGPGNGPPELAHVLVAALIERNLTLATAESCTGGGIGEAITAVPGSSACFLGGVIAYANAIKQNLLGVDPVDLDTHGAVSEPVARAMAAGARARLGSDLAIAVSGIAGPSGGTPDKPVGTVDLALAHAEGTDYKRLELFGNRAAIRRATVLWALKMVWDRLGLPPAQLELPADADEPA
ncbi:CinA family nicotinamide mononucleotide deamidase-related protein [Nannocystaceae bacterium ST9]